MKESYPSFSGNKKGCKFMKNTKLKTLVEGAIMIALATVLSFIKIYKLPWGGSITLLSMLPIAVFSLRHGVYKGLGVSFVFSLIQLFQGIVLDGLFAWGLTPLMLIGCIMLDYILPFTSLGIAGIFREKGLAGQLIGITIAILSRLLCHFLSGVVIFASMGMLWEGFYTENSWIYSIIYNASYMLPELIFTLIGATALLKVPQTKKIILAE